MSERLVWTFLEAGRASEKVGMRLETFTFAVQVVHILLMQLQITLSLNGHTGQQLVFHDTRGWEVIELCEGLFRMENRAAAIQGNYQKLLTILSKDVMSVADFGMVISDTTDVASGSSGSSGVQDGTTGTTSSVEPMEVVEVPVQADAQEGSTHLHIPQTIAIQPNMSSVKIAGVTV